MTPHAPSPTAALFVADNLALDFINTRYGVWEQLQECLVTDGSVVDWLGAAGVLPDGVHAAPRGLLALALALRTGARTLVEAALSATGADADADVVNEVLEKGRGRTALQWDASAARFTRTTQRLGHDGASLLAPVAEALVQLLADADLQMVRQCEGDACSLLFHDLTKSHRRRWCSMAVCGNRMKVAAFRARRKDG